MSLDVLIILVGAAFIALLFAGRRELAEGASPKVANGAVLLVLATLAGGTMLAVVVSLMV